MRDWTFEKFFGFICQLKARMPFFLGIVAFSTAHIIVFLLHVTIACVPLHFYSLLFSGCELVNTAM
jgi:hypothetical protein